MGVTAASREGNGLAGRVLVASHQLPLARDAQDEAWRVVPVDDSPTLSAAVESLPDKTPVVWIGVLPHEQRGAAPVQLARRRYVPVAIDSERTAREHELFGRTVLWPLCHNVFDTTGDVDLVLESGAWDAYRRVNEAFAAVIVAQHQPGDFVWINGYHLLLVPALVRRALPHTTIGLHVEVPFPSAEIFRCLPMRVDLLTGMLGANVIGFQTFTYARNFGSTCAFSLDCEATPTGVQCGARFTSVGVFPVGIDCDAVDMQRKDALVVQRVRELHAQYADRQVVLGYDHLDYIQGIPYKLLAFERFLQDNADARGKVVLLQVLTERKTMHLSNGKDVPTVTAAERKKIEVQCTEAAARINAAYGTADWQPVELIARGVSRCEYFALLTAADALLLTCIREGVNLMLHDFVLCQQDAHAPLILSEFASAAGCFSSAVTVNPWDHKGMSSALASALAMPPDERAARNRPLINYIRKHTASFWCATFLHEMHLQAQQLQIEMPRLDCTVAVSAYRSSERRLFMLDYDGTLTPIVRTPDAAKASPELLNTLNRLTSDPRNIVFVISGRDQNFLDATVGAACPAVGFSAEHGTFFKSPGAGWEDLSLGMDFSWKTDVTAIFETYADRTPGSFVESKRSSVTWHYRLSEPQFGAHMAEQCLNDLDVFLAKNFVTAEILMGKKNIEVRPKSISKGQVVLRLLRMFPGSGFVLCAGDDRTDEDMFRSLPLTTAGQIFTCLVGPPRKSFATYQVDSPADLIDVLGQLATSSGRL